MLYLVDYSRFRLALLVGLAAFSLESSLQADTFRLASGGEVRGEWLNREESPLLTYVIRQTSGIVLKLAQEQVREHLREQPAEKEYEELAEKTPDTVAGQWKLAEWCRDHRLTRQRTNHLARILELDPNHQAARALLGFTFVNGRWTTKQDYHHAEGYELYKGRWRTPQEIEILETKSKREQVERGWLAKLVRLRPHLENDQDAADLVSSIKDPNAIPALSTMLARERTRGVKLLYLDVLEGIDHPAAVQVIVKTSLADGDEEVFHACLDKIVRLRPPHIADSYIEALKDTSNPVVNRAAMALARIEDSAAVSPLIDALITVHYRTQRERISPDATAASFSADGGTAIMHNQGPHVIVARVQNQEVLAALTRMTHTTFGYDQHAWRLWHDQERRAQAAKEQPGDRRQ